MIARRRCCRSRRSRNKSSRRAFWRVPVPRAPRCPRLRPSRSRRALCRTAGRRVWGRRCGCSWRAWRKTRRCRWAPPSASAPPANITVRIVHLDGAPGFANGVVGRGAGGAGGEIRPAQTFVHREQARGHVTDEHRDHEGRDAGPALVDKTLCWSTVVSRPPMPEPMMQPISSQFSLSNPIPNPAAPDDRQRRRTANTDRCGGFPWAKERRA